MNVKEIRADKVYKKIIASPIEKRDDIYRHELMIPFRHKWDCYNVPLKAAYEGGYDVIMASEMLGFLPPTKINENSKKEIELISDDEFWSSCRESIEKSLKCFTDVGIELPVKDYLFTILLANPESPYTKQSEGYAGDGGIPGYIFGALTPNKFTKSRMPVALAHEANHNVRFQFIKWTMKETLLDMMINEGLAENFAAYVYGEENVGPWVSKTDLNTLNNTIKPIIKEVLNVQGLESITAYLYGDELAKLQGYFPVGLPYCAGYACGYHMIKYFLQKTGMSIVEATLLTTKDIMKECEEFWD